MFESAARVSAVWVVLAVGFGDTTISMLEGTRGIGAVRMELALHVGGWPSIRVPESAIGLGAFREKFA